MKVSIIIPCFNYGRFLNDCFQNLLEQTYTNWEAILIDDGSSDSTFEIGMNWSRRDLRIMYYLQKNSGVSAARNKGIQLATGDFIQFLDADDLLSKEKIALQVRYFLEHPEVDLTYTENHYFEDGHPQVWFPDQEFTGREWMFRFSGKGAVALNHLIRNNLAVISSPMIRRSLVEKTGGFDSSSAHTEDWKFWCQCVFAGASVAFVPDARAYTLVRVHPGSTSQNLLSMQYGELRLRSWLEEELGRQSELTGKEKSALIRINRSRKKMLVKHIMYYGPVNSFSHLKKMAEIIPWTQVIPLYFRALNYKRKRFKSDHDRHRSNHPVQSKH